MHGKFRFDVAVTRERFQRAAKIPRQRQTDGTVGGLDGNGSDTVARRDLNGGIIGFKITFSRKAQPIRPDGGVRGAGMKRPEVVVQLDGTVGGVQREMSVPLFHPYGSVGRFHMKTAFDVVQFHRAVRRVQVGVVFPIGDFNPAVGVWR